MRALDDLVRAGKFCMWPSAIHPLGASHRCKPSLTYAAGPLSSHYRSNTVWPSDLLSMNCCRWRRRWGITLVSARRGILTGKYRRADLSEANVADVSPTRIGIIASTGHLNTKALDIADVVGEIAVELGPRARRWRWRGRCSIRRWSAPIVGARTLEQAEDNFKALSVVFTEQQRDRLEKASALPPIFPARFMVRPMAQQLMFGGTTILNRRGNE